MKQDGKSLSIIQRSGRIAQVHARRSSLVIPSEARDLGSFRHPAEPRFLVAPLLGMTIGPSDNSPRRSLAPLELRPSNLPPPPPVLIAPLLLLVFRNHSRNLQ